MAKGDKIPWRDMFPHAKEGGEELRLWLNQMHWVEAEAPKRRSTCIIQLAAVGLREAQQLFRPSTGSLQPCQDVWFGS